MHLPRLLLLLCAFVAPAFAATSHAELAAGVASRMARHAKLFHDKLRAHAVRSGVQLPHAGEAFSTQASVIEAMTNEHPVMVDLVAHAYHHRMLSSVRVFLELAATTRGVCQDRPLLKAKKGFSAAAKGLQQRLKEAMTEVLASDPKAYPQRVQDSLAGRTFADGYFGAGTSAAVEAFQKNKGLSPVDGIVGSNTWAAICGGAATTAASAATKGARAVVEDAPSDDAEAGVSSGDGTDATAGGGEAVLRAAEAIEAELRSKYPNYGTEEKNGYGSNRKKDQYVCTTFVSAALRRAGFDFKANDAVDKEINIRGLGLTGEGDARLAQLAKKVHAKDPKTKGVVHALTKAGFGTEIERPTVATVAPGDLCQYWYNGGKFGHVVIVSSVGERKVKVIGSHGVTKGVGLISISLPASKSGPTYCVRPRGTGGSLPPPSVTDSDSDNSDGGPGGTESDDTRPGEEGDAAVPSAYDEKVEAMVEQSRACGKCKEKQVLNDAWKKNCANECALPPASELSGASLGKTVKELFRAHSGATCRKFELSWECVAAYAPHLLLVGGNLQASALTGGFEFVTDFKSAEVGMFVYGGLSAGTNLWSVGGSVYGGVGYKGKQSECCCKSSGAFEQDMGGQCVPDPEQCPCSLASSYKGYFLGADAGGAFGINLSGIVAMSAKAVFDNFDLDKTWFAENGDEPSSVPLSKKAADMAKIAGGVAAPGIAGPPIAPFFMTKPLTHLTKTIAVGIGLSAEVALSANVASTYYKFVGSIKCGGSGGGPGCFAGALAIAPPFPGMPGAVVAGALKVIQWKLFVDRWCKKPANARTFTCTAKARIEEAYQFWVDQAGNVREMFEKGADFVNAKLAEWDAAFDARVDAAKDEAHAWLQGNVREPMDAFRAHFGDVSPEKKAAKVYDYTKYLTRVGTFLKLFDCDGDITATTTNGVMWNNHQDNDELYFKCKWCADHTERDCKDERTMEVARLGRDVGASPSNNFFWRYELKSRQEDGFSMFWEGPRRGTVRCTMWERVRGLTDNEFAGSYLLFGSAKQETRDYDAQKSKPTVSDDQGRVATTCRYIYFHNDEESSFREDRRGAALLRRND